MPVFTLSRAGFEKNARVVKSVSASGDTGPTQGQEIVIGRDTFRVTKVGLAAISMEPLPNTPVAQALARHPELFEYRGIDSYGFSF